MELVYLYVEEYGNLKNKEFNFNPKHRFHYDSVTKELSYKAKEDFSINIFDSLENEKKDRGYISNVTAIVGGNGTGKTTLLKFILDCFYRYNNYPKTIFVVLDEHQFKCFRKIDVVLSSRAKKVCSFQNERLLENFKLIYCANTFDASYLIDGKEGFQAYGINDISIMGLIKYDKKTSLNMKIYNKETDSNEVFFHYDFLRQLDFICKYANMKLIPFKLPDYVTIKFSNNEENLERLCNTLQKSESQTYSTINGKRSGENNDIVKYKSEIALNFRNIYNKLNEKFLDKNDIYNETSLELNLSKGILVSLFNQIIPDIVENKFVYLAISKKCKEFHKLEINNGLYEFMEKFLSFIENDKKIFKNIDIDSYRNILLYFRDNNIKNPFFNYNPYHNEIQLRIDNNLEDFKEFYISYSKAVSFYNFLEFSWGLSTGEYNILSLLARFFSLLDKNKLRKGEFCFKDKCKNIIILIDEADITFHPKWQQKYLKLLVEFLQDIYENCNMQLIITTHSPIILSDIPLCNTIYLSDDSSNNNHIETFGANIYSIYNNSFFLDKNNIGMLGDFSSYHINKVNNILKKYYSFSKSDLSKYRMGWDEEFVKTIKKDLDYCNKIINLIGEKIIRQSLLKKYNYILKNLHPEENNNKKLQNIINEYDSLDKYEKEKLISYIIKKEDKDRG
ncbi:TPA: AAA family ATPase [Clostridioides difficile]|nr:AAA family ATPase [Clostridioides difficile]HBF4062826.1 AAA family ATPase [Clostridioides difficile]